MEHEVTRTRHHDYHTPHIPESEQWSVRNINIHCEIVIDDRGWQGKDRPDRDHLFRIRF